MENECPDRRAATRGARGPAARSARRTRRAHRRGEHSLLANVKAIAKASRTRGRRSSDRIPRAMPDLRSRSQDWMCATCNEVCANIACRTRTLLETAG